MKIVDFKTKKIYYDSIGKKEFAVTSEFWSLLKKSGIKYNDGKFINGVFYTELFVLKLIDKNFESVFKEIANSEMGKLMMRGKLPLDTIL